ncbi:MAG: echA1 [Parcubacteria group bacterium]|nr:echA1 [Parcubacteria group bacterium]
MKKLLVEAVGWYGTIAIVLAYALVSFSVLPATDLWYQVLNGTGAVGIVIVSFYKKAYQPGILNIVWVVIAVVAIGKLVL